MLNVLVAKKNILQNLRHKANRNPKIKIKMIQKIKLFVPIAKRKLVGTVIRNGMK